jgi:hypothetical protein
MANTGDLIGLQAEYPTAFADPEALPPVTTLPETFSPEVPTVLTLEMGEQRVYKAIQKILENNPFATIETIQDHLGSCSPSYIKQRTIRLVERNLIVKIQGKGRAKSKFFLPTIGVFAPTENQPTTPPEATGTVLGDAISPNLETMHPDQVRDFAEGHLQAAQPEPDEECRTSETEQKGDIDQIYNECRLSLIAIEDDADLLQIAADVLKGLAAANHLRKGRQKLSECSGKHQVRKESSVDTLKPNTDKGLKVREVLVNLPETNARQGTAECPGGLCSLD